MSNMRRLWVDFNTMNTYVGKDDYLSDERRRVLLYQQAALHTGERILLYQDEDDFEVEAVIRHDDDYGWFAVLDWSTRRDIHWNGHRR